MLSQWKIKPSALFILSCVVFLMLLIVVLPDVDLPDTAFHRGTDPAAIHALATTAPSVVMVAAAPQSATAVEASLIASQPRVPSSNPDPNSVPIILCSIRL